MDAINAAKAKFDATVKHLQTELEQLRAGRARPSIVESISVEYYNTKLPLRDLATITCPEANLILIQPWDVGATKPIEKAIQTSSVGVNPTVDGNLIRVVLPPMTEERRRELTKVVNEKVERARVAIRQSREEVWKNLRDRERAGEMPEDELFRQQKSLQTVVDEFNKSIEAIGKAKEKELLEL